MDRKVELVTPFRLPKTSREEYLTVKIQEKKTKMTLIRLRTLLMRFSKIKSLLAKPAKKGKPQRDRLLIIMLTLATLALSILFLIRR